MKQHGSINPKQESSNYVHNLPPRPTTLNQNRQNFNPPSIKDVPQPSLYYNGQLYNNAETSSQMAKKIGKNTMKIESRTIQSSKNNPIQSRSNPFNHFANPIQSKRETSSNKINSQNQTIKRANEQLQEIKQKEQSGKNRYVNRQESETARKKRQLNEEIKRRISQGMNQIRDEKIRVQGMSHIQDERIRPQGTNPIAQGGVNPITQGTNPILQGTNPIAQGINPKTQGTNPILQGANSTIQETNSINTNRVTEGLMDQREKLTLNVSLNNPQIHSNFPPLQIVPQVSVPRNQMGINMMGPGNYNPYHCNYNNANYNRRKTLFYVKKHKLNFLDEGYDKIITQQYTYDNFIHQCCYQLQMIYQQLIKESQSTYNMLYHRLQWIKLQQLQKIVLKEQIQFNITEILNKLNAKQQNLTRQIDLLSTQMDSNNECQHRLTPELFSIQSNGQIINHHKSNQQNGQHNQIKQFYRTISILHSQAEQLHYSLLSIQRLVN